MCTEGCVGAEIRIISVVSPRESLGESSLSYCSLIGYSSKPLHSSLSTSLIDLFINEFFDIKSTRKEKKNPQKKKSRDENWSWKKRVKF